MSEQIKLGVLYIKRNLEEVRRIPIPLYVVPIRKERFDLVSYYDVETAIEIKSLIRWVLQHYEEYKE